MEPDTYFEQRNKNDDVVSSEDEVIGNVENVENIVNDVKQWIEGEIFVGYLNMLLVVSYSSNITNISYSIILILF